MGSEKKTQVDLAEELFFIQKDADAGFNVIIERIGKLWEAVRGGVYACPYDTKKAEAEPCGCCGLPGLEWRHLECSQCAATAWVCQNCADHSSGFINGWNVAHARIHAKDNHGF